MPIKKKSPTFVHTPNCLIVLMTVKKLHKDGYGELGFSLLSQSLHRSEISIDQTPEQRKIKEALLYCGAVLADEQKQASFAVESVSQLSVEAFNKLSREFYPESLKTNKIQQRATL